MNTVMIRRVTGVTLCWAWWKAPLFKGNECAGGRWFRVSIVAFYWRWPSGLRRSKTSRLLVRLWGPQPMLAVDVT